LFAAFLLGVAGCATTPQEPLQTPVSPTLAGDTTQEAAPQQELTAELMFKLLVAEFAAQKGQLALSANTYLNSAEQTRDPRLARSATQAAVYARDVDTALSAARLWVELDPESSEARQSLAALLVRTGHADAAMPHLKKIIAAAPKEERDLVFFQTARLFSHSAKPEEAQKLLRQLTAAYGENSGTLYARAWLANQFGEHQKAQQLLQRLLAQQPRHADALILQARAYHAMGEDDKAVESLHRALKLDPDNDQMRLTYARMLIDTQKLKEARKEFRLLNQRMPDNSDVLYALGLLAMEAGEADDAEPYFMDLLRLGEREEEAKFALGQLFQMRQQTKEAIAWYQSVPRGARYLEAQSLAAQLMAESGDLDQALTYLRQLPLTTKEEKIQRYQAEAQLLASKMRLEEAMKVYDKALTDYPDNTELLYARALVAESIGRIDLLERDLKRILHKDPKNVQALNALGYTLADRTDRHEEAFSYIKQAYDLRSDDPAILDSMGWGLYHLGRLDEAVSYLRRAASMLRDAEIAAHLGEVLWVKGQQSEAKKVWNDALKFAPEDHLLKETMKRFNP